jgi:hypothetical protein
MPSFALRRAFEGVFLLGPATLLLGLGLSLMFSFALLTSLSVVSKT